MKIKPYFYSCTFFYRYIGLTYLCLWY